MIYVASPYSHDDPVVRYDRYVRACKYTASLIAAGHVAFSPIAHSHAIAEHGGLSGEWSVWKTQDEHILKLCDEMHVLKLDGWDRSVGVREEVRIAAAMGKAIVYVDDLDVHRE